MKIIRALHVSKAHGCDDVSIRMIRICDQSIVKPLSIIYQNCLNTGTFPDIWKKSNIVPVHKKGDKQIVNNYRPVSLLPVCGKILERLVFNSIFDFLDNNSLLSANQSGFRPSENHRWYSERCLLRAIRPPLRYSNTPEILGWRGGFLWNNFLDALAGGNVTHILKDKGKLNRIIKITPSRMLHFCFSLKFSSFLQILSMIGETREEISGKSNSIVVKNYGKEIRRLIMPPNSLNFYRCYEYGTTPRLRLIFFTHTY